MKFIEGAGEKFSQLLGPVRQLLDTDQAVYNETLARTSWTQLMQAETLERDSQQPLALSTKTEINRLRSQAMSALVESGLTNRLSPQAVRNLVQRSFPGLSDELLDPLIQNIQNLPPLKK